MYNPLGFTPNSISHNLVLVIYNFFSFIIKDEIKKEFYGTTLPARLEKFEALLKSRDEGKGFFLGEKVRQEECAKRGKGIVACLKE